MKIIITGGTGFLGSVLTPRLISLGHSVTIIDRTIKPSVNQSDYINFIEADTSREGMWMEQIPEHEAVINLAGVNVFQRWTNRKKAAIKDSRILTTRNISSAIRNNKGRTSRLINASAVGYYGFTGDRLVTEDDPPGDDFLAEVSSEWEKEALTAASKGVKTAICRFAVILGRNGGAISSMLPVFKMNMGARLGSGKQWFPWIHIEDIAGIISHLIKHPDITGPVNCASPGAITNGFFSRELAASLGKKLILPPVPGFALKIIIGDAANMLLEGQRVSSEKIISSGYQFKYPNIKEALADIV